MSETIKGGRKMDQRNRDMGINYIKTRKKHPCYGMGLGIIVLDDPYPGFPGDVRNASAFPYPIQYEIAEGVDNYRLVWKEDKSQCLEPIKRAAKRLEQIGCRAIAAECGYFAYFQKDIAGYVDIPVFMSSLLQVPFIQQVIGPQKAVGIHPSAKCGYCSGQQFFYCRRPGRIRVPGIYKPVGS
jgi:hypothetical protein